MTHPHLSLFLSLSPSSSLSLLHDRFTRVTCYDTGALALVSLWLISMCNMTHSHVWHDSFTCVAWRTRMCAWSMSHMRIRHATRVNETCHTCEWVTLRIEISHSDTSANVHAHMRIRHATHVNETCHTCEWVTLHMEIVRTRHATHVTHAHTSCPTYPWHMSCDTEQHGCVGTGDAVAANTCLVEPYQNMTHLHVWHVTTQGRGVSTSALQHTATHCITP